MSLVGRPAPPFHGEAVKGDKALVLSSEQYKGKPLLLFFYPFDFSGVCPAEILAFGDSLGAFSKRGVEFLACSVDSIHAHRAWLHTPREKGGVEHTAFPLLSDLSKDIARSYGVLSEGGYALRASFLIDKTGIVRMEQVYEPHLLRSVEETIRLIDLWQSLEKQGNSCGPAEG